MKNKIIIILCVSAPLLFFSCSSQLRLQKRTDKLIDKLYIETDTVYSRVGSFSKFQLLWYYKNDKIYSFGVNPHKTTTYIPLPMPKIDISKEEFNKYFVSPFEKDIDCFENILDGVYLVVYIKNAKTLSSGIDENCLFRNKYPVNSFPYKLQYTFSKILNPQDFDFEKMYSE